MNDLSQRTPVSAFWTRVCAALAGSALRRPWAWLAATALLIALSLGLAATRLELRTSNLDLVDHDLPVVAQFLSFAERFGSPNMLVVVLESADEAALRAAVEKIKDPLSASPGVRTVIARLPYDPQRIDDLGLPTGAYFASRDRRMFFVFVQPADAMARATTIAPFVEGVRGVLDSANLGASGVTFGLTGLPQYALDDRDVIQRDISWLSTLSFAVVCAILVAGFSSIGRPAMVMFALLLVAVPIVGFAAVVPGHLTLLSAFFFSALFGLGSDYGVYILHHMEELLAEGRERKDALLASIREIAPGLVTASLTTAAAFLTLCASGFKGFVELGIIGAFGILLSLVGMLTVLPALLAVLPDRGRRVPKKVHERRPGRALLALQRPALAGLFGAACLALALCGAPPFDGDYTHLEPVDSPAVRLEQKMVERSDVTPQFAAFVAKDEDRAADIVAQLLEEPSVAAVRSWNDLRQLDRVIPPDPKDRATFERLFRAEDGSLAIYAYPKGNIWDPAFVDPFLARMKAIDPGVTGMPVLGQFMIRLSRHALAVTGALSAVVVLLLVLLEFGLSRYALLAVLPTLGGVAATLGAMKVWGLAFNPLDIMAFPVIVGTGVDSGVHLTQRFLAERGDLPRTIAGAGHTVLISGLTTVVGFAALAFTSHRGLASFAIVLTLGSTICLVLSLCVLPLLLRLCAGGRGAARSAAVVEDAR